MSLEEQKSKPLWPVGLGSVLVGVCYLLTLGKMPILVFTAIGSVAAVGFYIYQLDRPIQIDRGAVLGGAVAVVGTLFAFSVLGFMGMFGWSPAGDLTELSHTYEGRGLSESEISLVYNVFVGDPTFNGVSIGLFLIVALAGVVGGSVTAVVLGGWKVKDSFVREKLYDWNVIYRPGEEAPIPSFPKMIFMLSSIAFGVLCVGILSSLLMDFLAETDGEKITAGLFTFFISFSLVYYSGAAAAMGYLATLILLPWKGNYRPARVKSVLMAVLSVVVALMFLSRF